MHEKFFEIARSNMVKNQVLPNNVKNKDLIDALLEIKKELFVPTKDMDLVYTDRDILVSHERNIIRTFVIAKMLDKCNFKKDNTILVIGCLTGYTLAIVSRLVNYVFGVDNDKNLTQIAVQNINNLNILNCSVFYKKDLSTGLEKSAPFDKIFIEGSVEKVPDHLLKQLKEDGEIFTVIKNKEDNYVGEFIRGLKVESGISIEKFFNTNVNVLKDFII
jgi:protein-L-isoaspartate(D-aspartate) O-methyltransferase